MPILAKHPYTSQASHTSSSDSILQENADSLLEQPVLPWMKSESRNSMQSSTTSLHTMKRFVPNNLNKKKRWSKHKWWLLLANTMVHAYKLVIIIKTNNRLKLFCYGLGIMLLALLTIFKCKRHHHQ
jgi:hypothetical protein